jgi:hypothetical protein
MKRLNRNTGKRAQKSAPFWFGSNPIMMEIVSGAIYIYVQMGSKGPIQEFKTDLKMTLNRVFDKFQAEYAKEMDITVFCSQVKDPGK